MVASGLAALDSSILATAIPSIVQDLGDFQHFPWLFSIYLLAQAVSVPLYAKLADLVGRKPLLLFGIGLFLVSSVLCAVAWSMPVLIIARGLQGLGAGAILPMTITIAGDIYTVEERSKIQGYLASVWAISSVVGPTLGGLFCQYLTWRWVFWINLPLGLVAAGLLIRSFHETVAHRNHKIDFAGISLLTVSLSLLILAVLEGGQAWAWNSPVSLGALGGGAVLLALFLMVERRAEEPVLPLWIFTRRLLVTTSMTAFGTGAVLLGLTSYVPTYLVRKLKTTSVQSDAGADAATGASDDAGADASSATPLLSPRTDEIINADWKFLKADAPGAMAPTYSEEGFQALCLPHTWNNLDGENGPTTTPNYFTSCPGSW